MAHTVFFLGTGVQRARVGNPVTNYICSADQRSEIMQVLVLIAHCSLFSVRVAGAIIMGAVAVLCGYSPPYSARLKG